MSTGSAYRCDNCSKVVFQGDDDKDTNYWCNPVGWLSIMYEGRKNELTFCGEKCALNWMQLNFDMKGLTNA